MSYRHKADDMSGSGIWQHASSHPIDPRTSVSTTVVYDAGRTGPTTDSEVYKVGVYGWRKRCLYFFILALTVVIVINLALTIWIMSVLDFTSDGMGSLQILDDGIRVTGRAEFDRPVHFRNLATAQGVALSIDSDRGLFLNARNRSGHVTSRISMNPDGQIQAVCDRFEVRNSERELLFFTDKNEIGVKVDGLRVIDDGGVVMRGAVQTGVIRPEPDNPLRLESPTRGLEVDATQDIELLSQAGDIQSTAYQDISFESKQGEIRLISPNLFVSGLQQGAETGRPQYQVCLCDSGKVFLARSGVDCRADSNICTS